MHSSTRVRDVEARLSSITKLRSDCAQTLTCESRELLPVRLRPCGQGGQANKRQPAAYLLGLAGALASLKYATLSSLHALARSGSNFGIWSQA